MATANKEGVRILLKDDENDIKATIEKITVNAPCVLDAESEKSAFSKVSVAGGVENVTLRGKTKIEQLVIASSESTILVGSNDVKIEKGADICGNNIDSYLASEDDKADITLPTVTPLDIKPTWQIWTDETYTGTALIDDFTENSISVTTSKTPSRYPWDANLNFWFPLEKETQYLVEFEAKFDGEPAETSFNVYDGTQQKNVAVAPFTPTSEWKKYRFMLPIYSTGAVENFPGYKGDDIEFSFRLTKGTLSVRNFEVYDCWEEGFQYESELNKWDVWFSAGCGASIMMYDISENAAKAIRTVSYSDKIDDYPEVNAFLTNVGYKLDNLEAGKYYFSFYSGDSNLLKLNLHTADNDDFAQAYGFQGSGNYYVVFEVPQEFSKKFITMQFWISRPQDEKDEWQYNLIDKLDVSEIKWGTESELDIPNDSIKLNYTTEVTWD